MQKMKKSNLHFADLVADARQFFLGLPQKENSFTIVSVGCESCLPGYTVDRGGLSFSVMELVVEGEGKVVLNGVTHSLSPGSLFFYQNGVAHRIKTTIANPCLNILSLSRGKIPF